MNKSRNGPVIASMTTNIVGLAVAATALTSFAAFGDEWHHHTDGVEVSVGWNQPDDDAPCDEVHVAAPVVLPAPAPAPNGRYELQNAQRWIPERYEQVTVQECHQRRHGHWGLQVTQCFPVTQRRVVPGYYQTVQEWVWVPNPPQYQQYSQYPQRGPGSGQGRIGFRIGTR